jgi:hypothetical protein
MLCSTAANAEGIGGKNPDVPFGGVAIDLLGSGSVSGTFEQTQWDLIQTVFVGGASIADGLPVASNGELEQWGYGLSVMTSLSSRVTAQIQYKYSKVSLSNVAYTEVGAYKPPNIRVDHGTRWRYGSESDIHDVHFRLRVWLGAQE